MSMNNRKFTIEHGLYLLAFLIAIGLRFYHLGTTPLADHEAQWAIQSLPASISDPNFQPGPQPATVFLTYLIFIFLGVSDMAARFWPALSGSLMVIAPLLASRQFQSNDKMRWGLIIFAFGLAIDPGLVTLSRQAGSPIVAVSFFSLALAAFVGKYPLFTGIFGGLALISGPSLIPGILSLGIALVVSGRFSAYSKKSDPYPENSEEGIALKDWDRNERWVALISGILTAFLVGTLFFRHPQGVAAWLASIESYLSGWITPSGVPASKMILTLFFYELFPLVFFFVGLARLVYDWGKGAGTAKTIKVFSLIWLLGALFLVILYPNRQVADLAWVVVPLWLFVAFEVVEALPVRKVQPVSALLAGFVFLLLALFWLTLATISRVTPSTGIVDVRLLVPFGTLILIGLTTALVCLGWSTETGLKGLTWGLLFALFLYNLSVLWGSAQLRLNQPSEFWSAVPGSGQARLFADSLDFISRQETGTTGSLDVLVTDDRPSLRWALRNYPDTDFVSEPAIGQLPSIVITNQDQQFPTLAASYAGQDFNWWSWPGWNGVLPPNLIRWFNYREAPIFNQKVVLWIRSDLLLGNVPGSAIDEIEMPTGENENP